MLKPIFNFNERLLQEHINKIQMYIDMIFAFTTFLETKKYPGSSQFNHFMRHLKLQMEKELVDEDFVTRISAIEQKIHELSELQESNPNPLILEAIETSNKQKDTLFNDKENRFNNIILGRISTIHKAVSSEFYNCFINNVPEHNIPSIVNAAFTLIESQLQYINCYIMALGNSIAAINSIPSTMNAFYAIIPYYQLGIHEYTQQLANTTTNRLTKTFNAATAAVTNFVVDKVSSLMIPRLSEKVNKTIDNLLLATDDFKNKLMLLQEQIQNDDVIEKEHEKIGMRLAARSERSVRTMISQEQFTKFSKTLADKLQLSVRSIIFQELEHSGIALNPEAPLSISSVSAQQFQRLNKRLSDELQSTVNRAISEEFEKFHKQLSENMQSYFMQSQTSIFSNRLSEALQRAINSIVSEQSLTLSRTLSSELQRSIHSTIPNSLEEFVEKLDAELQNSAQSIISKQLDAFALMLLKGEEAQSSEESKQLYDTTMEHMDMFKQYLNVNLPISIDSMYDTYIQMYIASYGTQNEINSPTLSFQELEKISETTLEKQVIKLVDLSHIILQIIRDQQLIGHINDQAQRDLLDFTNNKWEQWCALKNSEDYTKLNNEVKRQMLQSMIKIAYKGMYGIAYLNKHKQLDVTTSLLEIFGQRILDCIFITNLPNKFMEIMEPGVQRLSNKMLSITSAFSPIVNGISLYQLDIILRRMEHYINDINQVFNLSMSQESIASETQSTSTTTDEPNEHVRIEDKLFLYSSGGGGHREAKNARVAEAKQIDNPLPTFKPLEQDLMIDWVPFGIGKWSTEQWNDAQKRGDIQKQEELVSQQYLADIFFGPFIYQKAYKLLEANPNIKEIVDTQAVCNKAVCQAVMDINKKYNRNIKISLTMTDLPTARAVHFWNGLKTLTDQERSVITVECMEPLIPENISKYLSQDQNKKFEEFFAMFCGPGLHIVINNQPPIRKEFLPGHHRTRDEINQDGYLTFKYAFADEREVLTRITDSKELPALKIVQVPVNQNDIILSVLLGSQGGQAIVDYARQAIEQFENPSSGGKVILTLYCSADKEKSSKIFQDIKDILDNTAINQDLIIIPLGMQNAITIAENLERDNLAITRTGGIASFEALVINQDKPLEQQTKFLLHSESKGHTREELLSNIPVWERGNAEYLMHKLDAEVVNTVNFAQEYLMTLNPLKYASLKKIKDTRDKSFSKGAKHDEREDDSKKPSSTKVPASHKWLSFLGKEKNKKPPRNMQPQLGWNCFDIAVNLAQYNPSEDPSITRRKFVQFALDHSEDAEFRELLHLEIVSACMVTYSSENSNDRMVNGLPNNMLIENSNDNQVLMRKIKNLKEKYEIFAQIDSYSVYSNEMKEQAKKEFYDCCKDQDIYIAYIKGYYAKNDWFAFDVRNSTSMINIAAKYIGKDINIYQGDNLTLIYSTNPNQLNNNNQANAVHIKFTGNNHFESLDYNTQHHSDHQGKRRGVA